ncbi:ABC transporter ATP-binding protein [Flavobacterium piscis]|uniref:Nitrate/nitrite transport system ATP-binding protein n=1 Tax=Flavobacterium piscis TaxID=1114874 RepID=A0ABU1YBL0_9FLAO|nr:ABC transporter ATP-binding protein [Flavobacterium piscis]MDR7211473.1 nitrate/nitrite transport system ATP-binding protein [Flavobacterium piscis]
MAYLELKNVCKSYGEGKNKTEVLTNINLKIEEGEFVAIVGFTGSGKTTLVNLIAGLIEPDSGEILFKGQPVSGTSHERGIIFQNYSLLPWLSVYDNIVMAVRAVFKNWNEKQVEEHVNSFIAKVNLSHATHKKPRELSGGMRQRVAVARALAMKPELILMDEPLGALDALTRGNLQEEILSIWSEDKRTALLITNDVDEGVFMADRVIPLRPGPKATLGPEFEITIDRPRDKIALNHLDNFKSLRNGIIEYLMEIGQERTAGMEIANYELPDLMPLKFD